MIGLPREEIDPYATVDHAGFANRVGNAAALMSAGTLRCDYRIACPPVLGLASNRGAVICDRLGRPSQVPTVYEPSVAKRRQEMFKCDLLPKSRASSCRRVATDESHDVTSWD